jgi:hypothetical protein
MEFTLFYQGPLKANGKLDHKQEIRRIFHNQLKLLWTQSPLNTFGPPEGHYLKDDPPNGEISLIKKIGSFRLAPLVTEKLFLIAELEITLLRPEAP